jgi:hypothetical protein
VALRDFRARTLARGVVLVTYRTLRRVGGANSVFVAKLYLEMERGAMADDISSEHSVESGITSTEGKKEKC